MAWIRTLLEGYKIETETRVNIMNMDSDTATKLQQILLQRKNNAVVGINRVVGAPQLTVVWYIWDGEQFTFSTTTDRAKYRNLQRDSAISLLVEDPELGYVVTYGHAEILEDSFTDAARPIVEKYMPNDIERGLAMVTQPPRVLIRVRPEKLLTNFR